MVSAISNVASTQQQFMNNIVQNDQQNCLATVNEQANNNVIIVNGVNISGDFTGVAATASTDATCLMVSNMEDSVQNILASILQQTNSSATDWFNGFQISDDTNTFNISQSITNNISQINESTCSANTTQSVSNNYVYVASSKIGGNFIGVTTDANASANCSMTNNMKNTTYNQAQAQASQSNSIQGMFVAIVSAFVLIIGLIFVTVLVLHSSGAVSQVGYQKAPTPSREDSELMAARSLGLTPDMLQSLARN